ncbi:hypothetical protein, partial [Treponema sp. R80B11-R83G3]
ARSAQNTNWDFFHTLLLMSNSSKKRKIDKEEFYRNISQKEHKGREDHEEEGEVVVVVCNLNMNLTKRQRTKPLLIAHYSLLIANCSLFIAHFPKKCYSLFRRKK